MTDTEKSRSHGDGAHHAPESSPARYWARTFTLFVILSAFWLVLSGRFTPPFFIFMIVSVGIILKMNPERPFRRMATEDGGWIPLLRSSGLFLRYMAWLVWNMAKANIEVARIILDPKLPIDPQFLVFRTTLQRDFARVVVANSITLTPGTITVDLSRGEYLVHAISRESAGAVTGAELQNVVGAMFGEAEDPPPEVRWMDSYEDLGR